MILLKVTIAKNALFITMFFLIIDSDFKTLYTKVVMTLCSCHVMYTFQSESTLYSCLNVKELLARSRHEIWRLSDCNWTQTQNHLVRKRRLNHLAKLAKWLRCVLSTYLYGVFEHTVKYTVQISTWVT